MISDELVHPVSVGQREDVSHRTPFMPLKDVALRKVLSSLGLHIGELSLCFDREHLKRGSQDEVDGAPISSIGCNRDLGGRVPGG